MNDTEILEAIIKALATIITTQKSIEAHLANLVKHAKTADEQREQILDKLDTLTNR